MKKEFVTSYVTTYFPIITAAFLSMIFAFASMHYATHYFPVSTAARLYLWFAALH